MNELNKILLTAVMVCLAILELSIGSGRGNKSLMSDERGEVRLMFYNTENFFDTLDDELTDDSEFIPASDRHWDSYRYEKKLEHLYKTIVNVGEAEAPEIICMAEIENRHVLNDLIRKTPLEKFPYAVIHFESPDRRGIDVGLLYRKDKISVLNSAPVHVTIPGDSTWKTRDILYAAFITLKQDTVHLFVNHWPSRLGGQKQSEERRKIVARLLKLRIDLIFNHNPRANIIITGDFNDQPSDESITGVLDARFPEENPIQGRLYNLSAALQDECMCGTYRYKAEWDMLDQFIVSGALLIKSNGLHTCEECVHVANFPFLLVEDKKYGGLKPFRTYQGPRYLGGFSDHLPIYLDLFY